MRRIVISVQNSLLATLIEKSILERGEMLPVIVEEARIESELVSACVSLHPDVLLLEFAGQPPFDNQTRLRQIQAVRQAVPQCRIAGICDDRASRDLGEQVVMNCKSGILDNFFYMSVSGEYLAAALEAM